MDIEVAAQLVEGATDGLVEYLLLPEKVVQVVAEPVEYYLLIGSQATGQLEGFVQ